MGDFQRRLGVLVLLFAFATSLVHNDRPGNKTKTFLLLFHALPAPRNSYLFAFPNIYLYIYIYIHFFCHVSYLPHVFTSSVVNAQNEATHQYRWYNKEHNFSAKYS